MSDFVDAGPLDDLPQGTQRLVDVGGTPVLLCRDTEGGRVWAIHNLCPHAFQPLAGGVVRGGEIQCPRHGACFDLATGRSTNAVTPRQATVHAVTQVDRRIRVSTTPVPAAAAPTRK